MRHISFAWTTPAFLARRKTVTRRDWDDRYAAGFHAGAEVAAYERHPRYGGLRIGRIRLTASPAREWTNEAPESDWEAEGFGYLASIGASVHGVRPQEVWRQWMEAPVLMWVVRFEIIEVVGEAAAVDVQTRAPG